MATEKLRKQTPARWPGQERCETQLKTIFLSRKVELKKESCWLFRMLRKGFFEDLVSGTLITFMLCIAEKRFGAVYVYLYV